MDLNYKADEVKMEYKNLVDKAQPEPEVLPQAEPEALPVEEAMDTGHHASVSGVDSMDLAAMSAALAQSSDNEVNLKLEKYRHVFYFVGDTKAKTTCPEVMEGIFRFPIESIPEGSDFDPKEHGNADGRDEFHISMEFIESRQNAKQIELANKLARSGKAFKKLDRKTRQVLKRRNIDSGPYTVRIREAGKKQDSIKVKTAYTSTTIAIKRRKRVKKAENTGVTDGTVVARRADAQVQFVSLVTLAPGAHLNDEILEYGLVRALQECNSPPHVLLSPVHNWSRFFAQPPKVQSSKVGSVYRYLQKKIPDGNMLRVKYLFIPVWIQDHWFIAVVCQPFPTEQMLLDFDRNLAQFGTAYASEVLYSSWLYDASKPPKVLIFDSVMELTKKTTETFLDWYSVVQKQAAMRCILGVLCIQKKLWEQTGRNIIFDFTDIESKIGFQIMKVGGQKGKADCGLVCMEYLKYWLKKMIEQNHDYIRVYQQDLQHDPLLLYIPPELQARQELFQDICNNCEVNYPRYLQYLLKRKNELFPSKGLNSKL